MEYLQVEEEEVVGEDQQEGVFAEPEQTVVMDPGKGFSIIAIPGRKHVEEIGAQEGRQYGRCGVQSQGMLEEVDAETQCES